MPSPEHPGCIYGEMGMCLRPCQQVVGAAEYAHEVARVTRVPATGGRSLLDAIAHSRDRLSEEMAFEEAARLHKRFEKVQEVLKLRDELARELDRLNGVAVRALAGARCRSELWCVRGGHPQRRWRVSASKWKRARPSRSTASCARPSPPPRRVKLSVRERQEQLALLARWCYSSWRDGEWLGFDTYDEIPYRRLVHAISRVAHIPRTGAAN